MSHKAFYTFAIFAFISGLVVTYQFLGTVTPGTTKFAQHRQDNTPQTSLLAEETDTEPNSTTQAVANYVGQLESTQTVLGVADQPQDRQQPEVLGATTQSDPDNQPGWLDYLLNRQQPQFSGYITISSPNQVSINLHHELQTASKVTGTIYYGTNYPFSQKQANWYLVHIENTNDSGWVQAQFVTEVTN